MRSCFKWVAGCTLTLAVAACDNAVISEKTAEDAGAIVPEIALTQAAQTATNSDKKSDINSDVRSEVEVGAPAPQFDLSGSDGQRHKLSDYSGQHVVLAFFPKAFTGG